MPDFRPIRLMTAIPVHEEEARKIIKCLKDHDVPAYWTKCLTRQGNPVIKVFVSTPLYNHAWMVLRDLVGAQPQEGR